MKTLDFGGQMTHTKGMKNETFDLETLALLDALEADLDPTDLDFDADEEEPGWGLFGWDGPDED